MPALIKVGHLGGDAVSYQSCTNHPGDTPRDDHPTVCVWAKMGPYNTCYNRSDGSLWHCGPKTFINPCKSPVANSARSCVPAELGDYTMSSTPVDVDPSFWNSEAALTTVEGTSIAPAQVRERVTPLFQTSDFSASRVPPPRATCVLFVNLAARALEGRKI